VFGQHQITVAYARAEQSLHPVTPVVQQPAWVDARPAQPIKLYVLLESNRCVVRHWRGVGSLRSGA
jgi:hypothetical protein